MKPYSPGDPAPSFKSTVRHMAILLAIVALVCALFFRPVRGTLEEAGRFDKEVPLVSKSSDFLKLASALKERGVVELTRHSDWGWVKVRTSNGATYDLEGGKRLAPARYSVLLEGAHPQYIGAPPGALEGRVEYLAQLTRDVQAVTDHIDQYRRQVKYAQESWVESNK